jgi:alpha-glucosidase
VYLPTGPACWYAFDTGLRYAAGETAHVDAPLERIPLFCPAGAVLPTTDTTDYSRLTDEPSRALRVFAPPGASSSAFTLYEDDGISLGYRDGQYAEVTFEMKTSADEVRVLATATGNYALPYDRIRVVNATGDPRPFVVEGRGIRLTGESVPLRSR